MSYEGYEEYLCENGHYFTEGAYWVNKMENVKCPHCDKFAVWHHPVDETNNEGFPYSVGRLKVKRPSESKMCIECGYEKEIKKVTYHIPTEKDMKAFYEEERKFFRGE